MRSRVLALLVFGLILLHASAGAGQTGTGRISGVIKDASGAVSAQTPATEPVPTSTMSGVYSTAQAGRGEETYMSFCVSCHPLAVNTGEPFKVVWGGRLVSDLFGAIKEKMPKNDPGSLTAQEVAQVIAYLMKMNDIPAGKTELSDDVEALKTMRIETPAMRQGKAGG